MEFLEIGGSEPLRSYWKMYLPKVLLLIYVVDSADHARLPVAKQLLHQLIQNNSTLPVVVLANKQDLEGAYCITDIHDALALSDIGDERKMFLIGTHVAEDGSEISSSMKDAKELIAQLVLEAELVGGNQETIWTLSRGAARARLSPRTAALAKPKQDFGKHQRRSLFLYGCGRESTTWERPLLEGFGFPSDRLLNLSEPKKYQAAYLQQSDLGAARSYQASPRILGLARPQFLLAREVPTLGTNAGALARASSRLQHLAEPRVRKVTCYSKCGFRESSVPEDHVSKLAQEAIVSPQTLELDRAKRLHPDCVPLWDAEWPVTKAAKQTVATPRLVELAQPCKRPPMGSARFNPDVFKAQKATCSARIQDLACPMRC
ncbi:PREDICTED: LOW QUALITY PROTEIN: testicular haploid expressed gene protein-like [Cariama cristata]|uniref:LOW QUALITY PROTEIN: testicular haploid expressed gene protein-like n=1 Tax=Cariama cristata TaxID=54380 RepID=UPI000520C29C|nr:PREDICTED: LOW QUALITY PROTEIN: testicular haploid expressed gene protein-like [Cariama cristata]